MNNQHPPQNQKPKKKRRKWLLIVVGEILIFIILIAIAPEQEIKNENINTQDIVETNENINSASNSQVFVDKNINTKVANTNDSGQTNAGNTNTNTTQTIITTAKTINNTAIQLVPLQTGYCKALAPAGWTFTSNTEATGADLFSSDRSQHAGWGISPVYKHMYPEVESFLSAWLSFAFTGSFDAGGFTLGEKHDIYEGFVKRDFTTSTDRQGVAIYKTYNFDNPTMYVVSVYMADTESDKWFSGGATPFSVALSIRCVSQLRPTTSSVDLSSPDPSSSSDNPEVSLSEKWTEAIMGFENVYSPSTGEHYEAPLTSKWETGPEGSGYYRSLPGGAYEKLEHGFGDY